MRLTPIRFPSAAFPAADLRLSSSTVYRFMCPTCATPGEVPLGGADTDGPMLLTGTEQNAIADHFAQSRPLMQGEYYRLVRCDACGAAFAVAAQIEETSIGASRIRILDAAQISDGA